jgi:uncharacterized protein YqfA (UPF0365 family)/ribosomal protein L40E
MLLAQAANASVVLLIAVLVLLFIVVNLLFLISIVRPWMQAILSATPVSVFDILGMRLRRSDVNAVLKWLILARQAGVAISCRQMESACLQGVDPERLTLAMIQAKKQGLEVTFEELVASDLEGRLAEKLTRPVGSISGMGTARGHASAAAETQVGSVRICQKCSQRVTDDSKICRNCGAIL